MLDRDGRKPAEAHWLIDWCQNDQFWRPNIGGMPKFRAKYDQLRLRAQSNGSHLRAVSGGNQPYLNPDESEYDAPMFPTEDR